MTFLKQILINLRCNGTYQECTHPKYGSAFNSLDACKIKPPKVGDSDPSLDYGKTLGITIGIVIGQVIK